MEHTIKAVVSGVIATGAVLVLGSTASAVPITGTLDLNGGTAGVTITNTTIDWDPVGGGTGTFVVTGGTGSFAGLAGTNGTVKDLSNASQPVGTPFTLAAYMTFAANPDIVFDLTSIPAGDFTSTQCTAPVAMGGQTCTPPGSPFDLLNTSATSSSVTLDVAGIVRRVSTGETSLFTGLYTTQFPTMSFQQVLAALATTGSVHSSYSGSFTATVAPVPEPTSLLLLGTGFFGAALRARKGRK